MKVRLGDVQKFPVESFMHNYKACHCFFCKRWNTYRIESNKKGAIAFAVKLLLDKSPFF